MMIPSMSKKPEAEMAPLSGSSQVPDIPEVSSRSCLISRKPLFSISQGPTCQGHSSEMASEGGTTHRCENYTILGVP